MTSRSRMLVWLLLLVALLARVGYVATHPYVPRVDDADYLRLGVAIAHSGVYPDGEVWVTRRGCPPVRGLPRTPCVAQPRAPGAYLVTQPTAYRPPAYPYALAVPELIAKWSGLNPLNAARAFQVLIGVLDVALLGLLARMLWGSRVGLIALGLAAVYVPFILVSATLISEPLFVAFMLGAICAALRWRRRRNRWMLLAAGVLAGLSALTRTNGVVVIFAVALLFLTGDGHRQMLRCVPSALLVTVVGTLTIAPWTIRNAMVFERFVPISTEDGGTLVGTYNSTSRSYPGQPGAWLVLSSIPEYGTFAQQEAAHPEPVIDAALRREALDFATAHPAYVLSVMWHNMLRLFDLSGLDYARSTAATIDIPGRSAVAGVFAFYVVALLALAGALLPAARQPPGAVWAVPLLLTLSTILVTSQTPRFRTPIEPFIVLLASLALERLARAADGATRRLRGLYGRTDGYGAARIGGTARAHR